MKINRNPPPKPVLFHMVPVGKEIVSNGLSCMKISPRQVLTPDGHRVSISDIEYVELKHKRSDRVKIKVR